MAKHLLLPLLAAACVSAFVAPAARGRTSLSPLAAMDVPPAVAAPASFEASTVASSSSMQNGIAAFLADEPSPAVLSSTEVLSLKDRPPPPTPEEIAAKKATFNLWFWGGGFVAPFLATFYYFGFKFWER
ncbi:hypothetical protein ACHAXT_010065 [Thalassiosira profunda]